MATLITMAVYSTPENGRIDYTKKTLLSLLETVNFKFNRLFISDNGSHEIMHSFYKEYTRIFGELYPSKHLTISYNNENLGTAKAVNIGLVTRQPDEYFCKIDDDCIVNHRNWLFEMEYAMAKDESIGILGLKRKDLAEHPNSEIEFYQSHLRMLPHVSGEPWIVVEDCQHIMGTCQMLSPKLIEKIGFFKQIGVYGFDDSLLSLRSYLAGFNNCFLPHIDIDHIDNGGTEYTTWKQEQAGKDMESYSRMVDEYKMGIRPVYYDGGVE